MKVDGRVDKKKLQKEALQKVNKYTWNNNKNTVSCILTDQLESPGNV